MKIKLILLSFVAFGLVGCISPLGGNPDGGNNNNSNDGITEEPTEFGGYRRVDTPVDDHTYVLGIYQAGLQEMIFMQAQPHIDEVGAVFPWYFATSKNEFKDNVTVTVNYLDSKNFTMYLNVEATNSTYDEGYLCVYEDSGHISLGTCEEVTNEATWYILDEVDGKELNSPACDTNFDGMDEETVGIGTYNEYETVSCCRGFGLGNETDYPAHFWEKI